MKNLYVFDIDNTLKPYIGKISDSTKKAVALLKEHHDVCIASGRCFKEVELVAKEFDIDYCICSGGLEVFYKGKRVYTQMPDLKDELKNLKKEKPIHLIVKDDGIYSYHFPSLLKVVSIFRFTIPKMMTPYHILGYVKDVKVVDQIDATNIQKIVVFSKYNSSLYYKQALKEWKTFEGIDKTIGVKYLLSQNHYHEVISFGDSFNDLSLAKMANRSYAYIKGNQELIDISDGTFDLKEGIYTIVLKELEKM